MARYYSSDSLSSVCLVGVILAILGAISFGVGIAGYVGVPLSASLTSAGWVALGLILIVVGLITYRVGEDL